MFVGIFKQIKVGISYLLLKLFYTYMRDNDPRFFWNRSYHYLLKCECGLSYTVNIYLTLIISVNFQNFKRQTESKHFF